jgi:hypothetical protein
MNRSAIAPSSLDWAIGRVSYGVNDGRSEALSGLDGKFDFHDLRTLFL